MKKPVTFARSHTSSGNSVARQLTQISERPQTDKSNTPKIPQNTTPSIEGGSSVLGFLEKEEIQKEKLSGNVDALLTQAAALSASDRKKLLDELAMSTLKSSDEDARDKDMWSVSVYEALQDALGTSGSLGVGPVVIKRLLSTVSAWTPVSDFMKVSRLSTLTVQERLAAYRMLAKLLVKHARRVARHSEVPLSPKLVTNCVGNLPGVFDENFPGYVRAGLARVVVTGSLRRAV